MSSAGDIPRERFTAMLRLDHNRAVAQLAAKVQSPVSDISQMGVWGNHSPTMYPDLFHAQIRGGTDGKAGGQAAAVVDDQAWIENDFLPNVGKRGAAIIEARGASSAASAANAAIDHVYDWVAGTDGRWVSMGVPSDGSYGIPEGLICGFPCTCADGKYTIVPDIELDEFSRSRIDASVQELVGERDTVSEQGLI
jgi:malate dehydrogenase